MGGTGGFQTFLTIGQQVRHETGDELSPGWCSMLKLFEAVLAQELCFPHCFIATKPRGILKSY